MKSILTERRLKTLAVIAWISGMFLTFLNLSVGGVRENPFVHAIRSWYGTVIGNGAVALIVYFYIMIYLGIRKRKIVGTNQVTRRQAEVKLEAHVAKTSGLITLALFISFVQRITVAGLGRVFLGLREYSSFRSSETLLQLHSLANPLIYYKL